MTETPTLAELLEVIRQRIERATVLEAENKALREENRLLREERWDHRTAWSASMPLFGVLAP